MPQKAIVNQPFEVNAPYLLSVKSYGHKTELLKVIALVIIATGNSVRIHGVVFYNLLHCSLLY